MIDFDSPPHRDTGAWLIHLKLLQGRSLIEAILLCLDEFMVIKEEEKEWYMMKEALHS
ncbi:hypothetical protein LINPERHAP1_LOCUS4832 [Linum perenne]